MLDKTPIDATRFRVDRRFVSAARVGFEHLLKHLAARNSHRILLPAYLGLSPIEGSGVFDPVRACGIPYAFYRVKADLTVDLEHLGQLLTAEGSSAVLLIHYFGAPQPEGDAVRSLCDQHETLLIEDCAHCLEPQGGAPMVGRTGDAVLLSIHKVLPTLSGGILQINNALLQVDPLPEGTEIEPAVLASYYAADWEAIAKCRRRNYALLAEHIKHIEGLKAFWPELPAGAVPLNFPVLIHGADRFAVYKAMRARNYGVIALYHTLIDEIRADEFVLSHRVAASILNLPIHQEVNANELAGMAAVLEEVLRA